MAPIVRRLCAFLALCAAPWAVSPLSAAPCSGFTDVDDQDPFCKNVDWLKNRGITLGCIFTGTLYCPNDVVNRLAMSAFLNRLGNALTPVNLTSYNTGNSLNIDAAPLLCSTVDNTPAFPRTAHGVAVIGAGCSATCSTPPSDDIDFAIGIVESTNKGATWTPVSPLSAVTAGTNARKTASVLLPPRDLAKGTPYRWAVRVTRVAGSATIMDPGSWQCQFQVRIENRVTQAAPYEEDE